MWFEYLRPSYPCAISDSSVQCTAQRGRSAVRHELTTSRVAADGRGAAYYPHQRCGPLHQHLRSGRRCLHKSGLQPRSHSYEAEGAGTNQGSLQFGKIGSTMAMCHPDPLSEKLSQQLGFVQSYVVRDGQLNTSLTAAFDSHPAIHGYDAKRLVPSKASRRIRDVRETRHQSLRSGLPIYEPAVERLQQRP